MVRGLDKFTAHFKGMEENYVLIGGSACDLWFNNQGLTFRATKDIDMVIIVEALHPDFVKAFWDFIHQGKYKSLSKTSGKPQFYRFKNPEDGKFPEMIELLSRNQLDFPEEIHLTPIPVDDDISSLSAILLNDDYYQLVIKEKITITGSPTIPPQCLIPLKARAHLDLKKRKDNGDKTIKETDIKKHRNDVFRLIQTLAPEERFILPATILSDVKEFLATLLPENPDWQAIKKAVGNKTFPEPEEAIQRVKDIFRI